MNYETVILRYSHTFVTSTGVQVRLTAGTELIVLTTLTEETARSSGPMYLARSFFGSKVKVFVTWTEKPGEYYKRKLTEKPMTVTERRIRDLYSMNVDWREPESISDAKDQRDQLHDAMVAGQSLDDLGKEENDRAWNHLLGLQKRADQLDAWLKEQK